MEKNSAGTGRFRLLVPILICLLLFSALALMLYVYSNGQALRAPGHPSRDGSNAGDLHPALYTVGVYEGRIGIWTSGGMLLRTLDVWVDGLPEADRILLRAGFSLSSRQELAAVIEDYTG